MKKYIAKYRENPLVLTTHAWFLLLFSLFMTYGFLPYAQSLYHGNFQLAGFLLHRSITGLFLLSALMALMSFFVQLFVQITSRDLPVPNRLWNITKGLLAAAPVVLLGSIAALFLLIGKYMGLTLD